MVTIETISIVFTGISISLAAFYYINTLRNTKKNQQLQLETRQAQLFMNIHTQSFCNLEWSNSLRKVMRVEWSDYEDFTYKYQTANPTELETAQQIMYIFNFFEGLGVYVRDGLIDVRLVALTMTAPIVMTWEKYAKMKEKK